MTEPSDWRLTNQEKYLTGVELVWATYKMPRSDWDHDHCEFCHAKFMEPGNQDCLHEGYATVDLYYWICKGCFEDFRERFQWRVVDAKPDTSGA